MMVPVMAQAQMPVLFDIPIALPEVKPQPPAATVLLGIGKDGHFSACGQTMRNLNALPSMLEKGNETRIMLSADRSLDYKMVLSALEGLRELGFLKVGLVAADADQEAVFSPEVRQIKACRNG
ncbi:ExbD/TolR family protein [Endobacterium cereale]|nr:biopolymer transporter ExbD [Endobacterium cereale]MEB2846203.1 biopolymer transporter ExbD [Endobacterium cereale]